MKTKFDVLIVGAGIAGLSQAIALAEKDSTLSIGVVTKSQLKETNTRLAQGGIAAVLSTQNDSYLAHIEDTINASQNQADRNVVSFVVENAHQGIHQLENWGVRFDKVHNDYHLGLEGGHSHARILHVKDQTGAAVHDELINQIKKHHSIAVLEFSEVIELLMNKDCEVGGAFIYDHKKNSTIYIYSKMVVLATGGIGQLFQYTTNSTIATGDGIALAHAIGAKINNLQSIQFHPTAFRAQGKSKLFLISEAVRGAGAHIINKVGERFLFAYDERGELATRDVISSAIYQEMKTSREEEVYLDCRHISKEVLKREFPYILDHCLKGGFDLTQEVVPIIPAAHYSCGGIQVNLQGESDVSNLYAIGECANTGLHGNNRLASNSLLEAIVFTENVANSILNNLKSIDFKPLFPNKSLHHFIGNDKKLFTKEENHLKVLLTSYFITKNEGDKESLLNAINQYKIQQEKVPLMELSVIHFKRRLTLIELILEKINMEFPQEKLNSRTHIF